MRKYRGLALGASVFALVISACTAGGSSQSPSQSAAAQKPKVTVGSADFYESTLVAEMYAQALEAKGYTVERKLVLGARKLTNDALKNGQLNLMPEYIGSDARELKAEATGDPQVTAANLKKALEPLGLTLLDVAPGQDQNGFVVRQETATKYKLKTLTDLAAVTDPLKWGLPPECKTNPSCHQALLDSYGIDTNKLADAKPSLVVSLKPCSAPMATALNTRNPDGSYAVDVAELCTTQPAIQQFNFVLLEDDKHSQPVDNMAPVVRKDLLDAAPPDFAETLNAISAKLTTDDLTALGVEIVGNHKTEADVAKKWLTDNGLI
ncbi:MAG: ABC transporter substrate-binding protein [Chloroflexota bacterium]|nr:ABC transporter substrate-binding protein [Chloroflexota bacterium]